MNKLLSLSLLLLLPLLFVSPALIKAFVDREKMTTMELVIFDLIMSVLSNYSQVSENTSTLSTEQTAKQIVDYQIANPKAELFADDVKIMYDEIVMKNTKGLFN